jgi:hypothetical protein
MASAVGTWKIIISTPIGRQHVRLQLVERGGRLEGTATQGAETVPLVNASWNGTRLTWSQSVTKPLKLDVKFDVNVADDQMVGTAKAGVFPASKVEGAREPSEA